MDTLKLGKIATSNADRVTPAKVMKFWQLTFVRNFHMNTSHRIFAGLLETLQFLVCSLSFIFCSVFITVETRQTHVYCIDEGWISNAYKTTWPLEALPIIKRGLTSSFIIGGINSSDPHKKIKIPTMLKCQNSPALLPKIRTLKALRVIELYYQKVDLTVEAVSTCRLAYPHKTNEIPIFKLVGSWQIRLSKRRLISFWFPASERWLRIKVKISCTWSFDVHVWQVWPFSNLNDVELLTFSDSLDANICGCIKKMRKLIWHYQAFRLTKTPNESKNYETYSISDSFKFHHVPTFTSDF